MTSPSRVLVVGTFPPIPLPSAAASVAALLGALRSGDTVTTVSPRFSAADLTVPVAGLLAGRRLENVRRRTGADQVVLVAEAGFPLPERPGALQWVSAVALGRALARFDRVTLVRVGSLGLPPRVESRLLAGAGCVLEHPDDGSAAPGVTPLGPPETLPRERPRQLAGMVARRLLGSRWGSVRSRMGAFRRAISRPGSE